MVILSGKNTEIYFNIKLMVLRSFIRSGSAGFPPCSLAGKDKTLFPKLITN
jgi:hypothetical protein